jgi:hypothetical protein
MTSRTLRPAPAHFRSLALLAALTLAGCLNDTPVAPTHAKVSLNVSFQAVPAQQSLRVEVYVPVPENETSISLFDQTFSIRDGQQQLSTSFDLRPCLSQFAPDDSGPYCDVYIDLQLLAGGVVSDERGAGPVRVRPGQVAQAPQLFLVAGNNAPVVSSVDTAVLVESGLVKFRVTGADQDGDLLTVTDSILDANNAVVGVTTSTFGQPRASFHGELYSFVRQFTEPQTIRVAMGDYKSNLGSSVSVPLEISSGGVIGVFGVRTDTTADSVQVEFSMFDESQTSDSVEVVFRNQPSDTSTADTLYFVCAGKFATDSTSGNSHIGCKRQVPFTQAIAIVVPVTPEGDWGSGARCGVPGDCLGSFRRVRDGRLRD